MPDWIELRASSTSRWSCGNNRSYRCFLPLFLQFDTRNDSVCSEPSPEGPATPALKRERNPAASCIALRTARSRSSNGRARTSRVPGPARVGS